jgi:hypothetical protein
MMVMVKKGQMDYPLQVMVGYHHLMMEDFHHLIGYHPKMILMEILLVMDLALEYDLVL